MSQVDWSKAPEWATHALVKLHNPNLGSTHWSCLVDGEHRVSPDGLWFHPDGYRVAGERPRKIAVKEWNGEGLPPVGIECEYLENGNGDWKPVRVVALDEKVRFCDTFIVFHGDNGYSADSRAELFRPIRTPEQIAASARNKAAAEMSEATQGAKDWHEAFKILHDKGYRRFEIVEGDQ